MIKRLASALRNMFHSMRFYIVGVYQYVREENILFLSSGIAFNGLLCLLPLLLLCTSLLGMFLSSSKFPSQKLDDILNAVFPLEAYAQQIKLTIKGVLEDIIRYRSKFGFSGLAVLVWTATSLFSSVRTVVNKIYRIKPTKLVVITILEDILLVIVLGALFLVANVFTWALLFLDSLIKEVPALDFINLSLSSRSVQSVMSYIAALVMFFIVNKFIPDKRVPTKIALIAAITSTSLWWIAGKAFGWYVSAFHSYSKVYGTYAFLFVFLVWIYYSSIVFVIGVVIGELYHQRHPQLKAFR